MLQLRKREVHGEKINQLEYQIWINNLQKKLLSKLQHFDNKITFSDQHGNGVPPYACAYCTAPGNEDTCLVVDEEGFVSVINTHYRWDGISNRATFKLLSKWLSHNNAAFDVCWVPKSNLFVTASGDTTAILWDVTCPKKKLNVFQGHSCSLKSISVSKHNPNILATGSRDGNVLIWDSRAKSGSGTKSSPILRIQDAHAVYDALTPQRKRRRFARDKNNPLLADSRQTVTSVVFQDATTLITSGAMDGTVKLWDVRKTPVVSNKSTKCTSNGSFSKECIGYPGTSERRRGYTSLCLDSTGSRLFTSCTDNTVYEYDLTCGMINQRMPKAKYTGHYSSSFYVRIALSPDDSFLLSGSDDEGAFIWNTFGHSDESRVPSYCLKSCGMEQVTAVSWCSKDVARIVSCSDDCAVRVWEIPTHQSKSSMDKSSKCTKPDIISEEELVSHFQNERHCKVKTDRIPRSPYSRDGSEKRKFAEMDCATAKVISTKSIESWLIKSPLKQTDATNKPEVLKKENPGSQGSNRGDKENALNLESAVSSNPPKKIVTPKRKHSRSIKSYFSPR